MISTSFSDRLLVISTSFSDGLLVSTGRNTAQIVSQAAIHADPGSDAPGVALDPKAQRKNEMMTQSRLMHLETEMHHMFDSVQRADESLLAMKGRLKERDALVKQLKGEIATLRFELESSVASETRAEALADSVSSKLAGIEFERVQLGFGATDARSQLDILQARNERLETVVAERNAEIKRGEQDRARLSFRVQVLIFCILFPNSPGF